MRQIGSCTSRFARAANIAELIFGRKLQSTRIQPILQRVQGVDPWTERKGAAVRNFQQTMPRDGISRTREMSLPKSQQLR